MKKIVLTGLLLTLGLIGTGCTRGELSDGSNGIGIGIGMGPNPGPWDPYPPRDSWPPDDNYPDPWPNDPNDPIYNPPTDPGRPTPPRRPTRPPGSHCDRLGCWDPNEPNFVTWNDFSALSSKAENNLMAKYGVSKSVAVKIAAAFAKVRSQGMAAYQSIGLTENDIKAMMKRQLPSEQAIRRTAGKLALSEKQSRTLLTSMMSSFWAQAANVNSPYWKYCQMGGHWKTDRNRSCEALHWPGCSPKTGAQVCY